MTWTGRGGSMNTVPCAFRLLRHFEKWLLRELDFWGGGGWTHLVLRVRI